MLWRPRTRLRRVVGIVATSLLVGLLATGGSGLGPGAARADTLTLPLADLGRANSLTLDPPPSSQRITLPVPPGMTATRLRGTIEVTADGSGGILEVIGSQGRLTSVDLRGKGGTDVPLSVDLSANPIADHAVTVTLRLSEPDNRCVDPGAYGTVVRGLRLGLDGTDLPPTTIAAFLPPALRDLTIAVPANADLSVRAGAVRLASAIAARYQPATPTVRVIAVPAGGVPAQDNALYRTIAFTGTGDAGLELGADRVLLVNGTGAPLAAQVDALFSDLGSIAVTSQAVASRVQTVPQLPAPTQTLSQLGVGAPSATGRGTATVRLGVDAAALGQPAASWTVHLVGTVVTGGVGTDNRRGSLTLGLGDRTLGSWPVTGDGSYDISVSVPRAQLTRYSELVLTATADGSYDCGSRPVVILAVDPDSTIAADPAQAPTAGSFADLPAALRPSYQLASDRDDLLGLGQAVALAVALQRLTGPTLVPNLVETSILLAGNDPGVLTVHGPPPAEVDVPLDLTATTATLPDGQQLTADTKQATLQIGSIGDRSVAVVSGTEAGRVDGLLGWLGQPDHLASLSGDVAVWTGSAPVTTLALRVPAGDGSRTWHGWVLAVVAALAFAVILGAVVATVMLVRRRRARRRGGPGPDEDLPSDPPAAGPDDPAAAAPRTES